MQSCVLYLKCCLDMFMKQAIMTDGRQDQSQACWSYNSNHDNVCWLMIC